MWVPSRRVLAALAVAGSMALVRPAAARPLPPGELGPSIRVDDLGRIVWTAEDDARRYNVYKGQVSTIVAWRYAHVCFELGLQSTLVEDPARPASHELFYYLVSKENQGGEGPLGWSSLDLPRPDPLQCIDLDGDGVADLIDNCPFDPNKTQVDTDLDASGDACDADDDGDGLSDDLEASIGTSPIDRDTDHDGLDDFVEVRVWGSDPLSPHSDGDGVPDGSDNCPTTDNASQDDLDQDAIGDVCDNCVADYNPAQTDADGDGFGDVCDNCPWVANPDQGDLDASGIGDACEFSLGLAVHDGGSGECFGYDYFIDQLSVGQVSAGLVFGTGAWAEIGIVNGATNP